MEFGAACFSLIPYAAHQVARVTSYTAKRYDIKRRIKQCEQLQHWIRSQLRIATELDWGQTCELGEAINHAANHVLGVNRCWAFTSRSLLSRACRRNVGIGVWLHFVADFVNSDIKPNGALNGAFPTEWISGMKPGFKRRVFEHYFSCHFDEKTLNRLDSRLAEVSTELVGEKNPDWYRMLEEEGDNLLDEREVMRRELFEGAEAFFGILQDVFYLFRDGSVLMRCPRGHATIRAHQIAPCDGLNIDPLAGRTDDQIVSITANQWKEVQQQWIDFIEHRDDIAAKAAEQFAFQVRKDLHDLVLHDMATGYCASSAMHRKGAKLTSEKGTTIVHAEERGAVVTSMCPLIKLEGSAVEKKGIRRELKQPAVEFARYALLRCDLVKRCRMTLSEALKDWKLKSTCWDRAPVGGKLSSWNNSFAWGTTADDYRLVLIRQALGSTDSIDIVANGQASRQFCVFEGHLGNSAIAHCSKSKDRCVVLDRTLVLNVGICGKDDKGKELVHDTWGPDDFVSGKLDMDKAVTDGGLYRKFVHVSGKPDIFRLRCDGRKVKENIPFRGTCLEFD